MSVSNNRREIRRYGIYEGKATNDPTQNDWPAIMIKLDHSFMPLIEVDSEIAS